MADYGKLSRAMLAAAAKAGEAAKYRDPAATKIADWNWRPLADVRQEVPITAVPDYIQAGFGQFMKEQAKRAAANGLTDRDLLKAYLITQSSVGRGGLSHSTATKAGLKVPYATEVRPEGAFATWLGSPAGQRYLDAAQRGELDPKSMEDIRSKFAPFGKQNDLVDKMTGAVTAMPTMSPRLNEAISGSPEAYRDFAEELNGIAAAKSGFIGSLLGRGDLPTFDARQIGLHTSGMPMPTASAESMLRRGNGQGGREAVDRLAARQRAMGLDIDPSLDPHYQHLTHHAVWDALGGEKTTHQDLIDAMKNYAGGGPIHMAGAGKVSKGLMGALSKAVEAAEAVPAVEFAKTPFEMAHELAQKRAALPVSQGGLGLPAGNTAEQRAKATGFDTTAYHATDADILAFDNAKLGTNTAFLTGNDKDAIQSAIQGHWFSDRDLTNKDPRGYMFGDVSYPVKLKNPKVINDKEFKSKSFIVKDPDNIRSRFAAFDPFRKDVATAALLGVAAPDLLANEPDKKAAGGPIHMAGAGSVTKGLMGALTKATEAASAVMPAAERAENLQKFLEPSKTQMRLYHGTTATQGGKGNEALRTIKPSKEGALGSGVYLTPQPDRASLYTRPSLPDVGGNILPVHAQIRNPLIIKGDDNQDPMVHALVLLGMEERKASDMVNKAYENRGYIGKQVQNRAQAQGYDGLMQYDRNGELSEVVPFSSNQVKSAIGNEGTYDIYNPELNKAQGGVIHMATAGGVSRGLVGALTRAAEAAEAVKPLSKEREATLPLSAQQMEANRAALDAAKPPIKASEAYGQFEGSYLKPIFYDRMKVDLANRKFGGPGFSGIQHVDPDYGNVGATAGVTDKKMSTRILNRNTANVPQGANVLWTPSVGSPEQHRSNTTMFNTFANRFTAQRDKMDKALLQKMSDRASAAVDNNKKLIFPDGIDLSARNFRQGVKTYPQRTVLADIFGGVGVGGEEGRTVNVESLLEKNLDPYMGQANTHDLGNRLFTLNGGVIYDPNLHFDYPYILTGEDKKINYLPAPFKSVFDDYLKQKKLDLLSQGKDREVTQMDYTKGDPTVQLTDTLLSRIQKEGYKKGGDVGHGLHEFMVNKIKAHIDENYDLVAPPKMANGGEVQRFGPGGSSVSDKVGYAKRFLASLASQAKEQGEEEIGSLGKSGAFTDLLNRGVVAPTVGLPVDLINMGLTGIDTLSGKIGYPTRLSSEKPFGGSEQIKDLMNEYGVTSGEERPLMETGMSMVSPVGMVKGAVSAAKVLPKAARAAESGLNEATSAVRRPFTPATATVEAVAPDLAKYKPASWQEMATNRLTGEGAPVSMETVGGKRTTKRAGQGVYVNNEGQLETNPMVAVDMPFAGSLSGNKALRGDIATVGQSLNQEAMAAHRFVPMATNNIKDATAMLIKPKGGNLTNEQVIQLGKTLGGDMVVAHNPRLGGVVVYPFGDVTKGQIPKEFLDAQSVGRDVLGKDFSVQYGKADPVKDRMFMGSGDYASEGARPTSPSTTTMRERIKRAEQRKFPKRVQSPAVPALESGG